MSQLPVPPPLVTAEQAAQLCGVSSAIITRWVDRGYLRAMQGNDRAMLFTLPDLAKAERRTRSARRPSRHRPRARLADDDGGSPCGPTLVTRKITRDLGPLCPDAGRDLDGRSDLLLPPVRITRPDGLADVFQAAQLCGVQPGTIRQWVRRGHLARAGFDERGRSLFDVVALQKAEYATRERPWPAMMAR